MSTSSNLPVGAFITTLDGKRCTAVPRTTVSSTQVVTSTSASTSTSTSTSSSSSSSSSLSTSSSSSYASSSSPSSSSLFTSTSVSAAQVLEPPQVQSTTTTSVPVGPPAEASTSSTSMAQLSIISSATDTTTSVTVAPQPQTSLADTSVAILSTPASMSVPATAAVATAPTPTASPVVVATPPQSEPASSLDTVISSQISSTVDLGSDSTLSNTHAPFPAGTTASGVKAVPTSAGEGNSNRGSRSAAVTGGIIGGLAAAGLLVFFIWIWKRRTRKRRSTLLTPLSPLSVDPPFAGEGERSYYMIQRDSVGPTPLSAKVKAFLRVQYSRVRGRKIPSASPVHDGSHMTMRTRIIQVWATLGGSQARELRRNERITDTFSAPGNSGSMEEKVRSGTRTITTRPDLLREGIALDSEAQRHRLSRARGASVGTSLGGLDLNSGGDPFDDVNATAHPSANLPPLTITGANNPFSDANAVEGGAHLPKRSNHAADIRHSRGQSADSVFAPNRTTSFRVFDGTSRPPSGSTVAYSNSAIYLRDSASSFDTRRNKFRSDPFDLEPLSRSPNLYGGTAAGSSVRTSDIRRMPSTNSERYRHGVGTISNSLLAQGNDVLRMPVPAAHARYNNSLGSSRYTSGISEGSMGDWSAS